jgi:hypothetical protein
MWKLIVFVRAQFIQDNEVRVYSLEFNKQATATTAATFLESFGTPGSLEIKTILIHDQ